MARGPRWSWGRLMWVLDQGSRLAPPPLPLPQPHALSVMEAPSSMPGGLSCCHNEPAGERAR